MREPGVLRWRTPAGRTHTTTPTNLPALARSWVANARPAGRCDRRHQARLAVRVMQRILALTATIWHNDRTASRAAMAVYADARLG